jgi:GNAT superfamily N-acetyltransferase
MARFPEDLEARVATLGLPFKAKIELTQKARTLEIRFIDPQNDQKIASTMLEIWEGQLVTFEEFFDFMKPAFPEFVVTDLFVRPDLRYRGLGRFILEAMASLLNVESFGLFHVNTPFAGFWIHNNSILGTDAQDIRTWLSVLPDDWDEPDSIFHYTIENEVKSYDRITHGAWLGTEQLRQSMQINADEIIISRNNVLILQRETTALIVKEGWPGNKLGFSNQSEE